MSYHNKELKMFGTSNLSQFTLHTSVYMYVKQEREDERKKIAERKFTCQLTRWAPIGCRESVMNVPSPSSVPYYMYLH